MEKVSFKQCFKETMEYPQARKNFTTAIIAILITFGAIFFIDIYAVRMIQMIAGVVSVASTQSFLRVFSVVVNTMDEDGEGGEGE